MTRQKIKNLKRTALAARGGDAAGANVRRAPVALTIAGSDCSGGAGIEADLKVFHAHGVHGMAAVTCVVAENPRRVASIHPVPARRVRDQIACCLDGMTGVAVKTGMLFSAPIVRAVAAEISNLNSQISNLVVDPVMIATSGGRLLRSDALRALERLLEEHADLVTPNLDEAEVLAGHPIRTRPAMETGARGIARRFGCAVLMKGGHLRDVREAADFFWDGSDGFWLKATRVRGVGTHGTGCTYSAAITANRARGFALRKSVRHAKRYVTAAIRNSRSVGPWMALGWMMVCGMVVREALPLSEAEGHAPSCPR